MLQETFSIPDVEDVFGALRLQAPLANNALRVPGGWCRTLTPGLGFRHDYDREVARGGWEFHRFGRGLCVAVTDMVASRNTPRRHSLADQLVLSAVVEGDIPISNAAAREGDDGECDDRTSRPQHYASCADLHCTFASRLMSRPG